MPCGAGDRHASARIAGHEWREAGETTGPESRCFAGDSGLIASTCSPVLQAGGHRFDPGWLHGESACYLWPFVALRLERMALSDLAVNSITLVGHLTSDPVLRDLPDGRTVCDMRLAVNDQRDQPPLSRPMAPSGVIADALGKPALRRAAREPCGSSRSGAHMQLAPRASGRLVSPSLSRRRVSRTLSRRGPGRRFAPRWTGGLR